MPLRSLLLPALVVLAGCQNSGSGGLSLADRATTGQVCVQAGGAIKDAVSIGVQLAARTISPAQAASQLTPIQTRVDGLAAANAQLPVGAKLKALSTAISGVTAISSTDPSAYTTGANSVRTAAQAVLGSCAAVGR